MSKHRAPTLGEALVTSSLLTESQRDWALDVATTHKCRLGEVLVASGLVRRVDLFRVLADMWGYTLIDLVREPVEAGVLQGLDPRRLADQGWVPVRRGRVGATGTEFVLVATSERPTPALRATVEQALATPVQFQVTTDWDLRHALHEGFRDEIVEQATMGLWQREATQSARTTVLGRQKLGIVLTLVAIAVAAVLAPLATAKTAMAVVSLVFLASVLFKYVVCLSGAKRENHVQVTDAEVEALDPGDLPVYTVLVPVYREANVVADLIANLGALDYPAEKLEILLLLEQDDDETIAAAKAARPPETVTFVIVPPGHPQTKPKACNVGLFFARGEHLVIYDAEDKPDPDQLKKAVLAFRRGGDDLVCVQAALNYWNATDNWLTRMFTLEYSFWFDYMLPGLDKLHLPIPLGGTSNHFRTADLRELGGWDPFNVTEDADLGIRASALGKTVGVVNSTTFEEANRAPGNWVRQRSRWIKGYLQTLLVHARQPGRLVRKAGPVQVGAFALLIGGTPATFLCTPPLLALFVASLVVGPSALGGLFGGWVLWVSLFNLIAGNGLMIHISMMGAFKRRRYELVPWALLNPVYWLLHSIASYKALWQLITKPHYWEKTTHGLSTAEPDHVTVEPAGALGRPHAEPVAG
ncbi:glycosyltransferase family 2 protein [Solicola sp. PLA-1-18]|uniref:glycosyltransferase family 2 protein n=1 Tax=Solicola sp. PLA-1-18 TaxID=3380532 RepID=UPI003B7C77C0